MTHALTKFQRDVLVSLSRSRKSRKELSRALSQRVTWSTLLILYDNRLAAIVVGKMGDGDSLWDITPEGRDVVGRVS